MKRAIKFRAYDTIDKQWLFGYKMPNLGGFSLIGEVTLMGELNSVSLERWNDVDIMQYTGLKDKNGVEIYEGDRILYSNSEERGEGVISFHLGFNIEWDLKTVVTSKPSVMSPLFYFGCESEIEVIGNIYDNTGPN